MSASTSGPGALGDAADFRAIFFEEADEHVAAIESILLRLNQAAPDADELNAIFRAAHSIKGTSGMLGFTEITSLTHVLENLLDELRKGERPLTEDALDLMLRAGDMVKMQVAHRRGTLDEMPDASTIELGLSALVEGGAGVPSAPRRYAVRLGPLAAPIDAVELDLMLSGLAEMGKVRQGPADNVPGGEIRFEVELAGAEADLRSVLALVVPAEAIHVGRLEGAPAAQEAAEAGSEAGPQSIVADGQGGELFFDPAEWKKRRKTSADASAAGPAAPLADASGDGLAGPNFDLWVTPAELRARRVSKPRSPGRRASDDPAAAPVLFGRRASDIVPGEDRRGRRSDAERSLGGLAGEVGSIRVGIDKVDLLVNLVGELVITEAMLAQQQQKEDGDSRYAAGLVDLGRHARNLQEAVMSIRMVPISTVFTRFPRLVRELSQRFGKEVELKVSGETTEFDRGLIEKITDPLTHLVRNSIDHGIESPAEREAAGKPRAGSIFLSASQKGGSIVIEVRDDGRGLSRQRILAHAAERGMRVDPNAGDDEVWQLIFEAGFTTAEAVTDVSGRGVGMDVVRRNIQVLGGGKVALASREGEGTTVTVSVPLTLAIMEAMSVAVGSETYVLPLAAVIESRRVQSGDIAGIAGQGHTLRVRDEFLPVVRLSEVFRTANGAAPEQGGIAVIVESEGGKAALLVDDLLGQQQVVVKSLDANFRRMPGVSSATIMGDGRVALILDLAHIVQFAGKGAVARH
jgi:two-component system, chemotaxis family, sensor kinase CheA